MEAAIATVRPIGRDVATDEGARRLVQAFLSGESKRTLEAYRADLEGFRQWLGSPTVDAAARELLNHGPGRGNELALEWKTHLLESGLSPSSINRRLSALRSLVALGQLLGYVPWKLSVPGLKSVPYKDVRGPGVDGVQAMLDKLNGSQAPKARRDRAILRLLFDLGLRRQECVSLDLEHLDLEGGTLSVLGKGKRERQPLTIPEPTRAALAAWVEARGEEPGPLLRSFDRARKGDGRLSGRSLHRLIAGLGKEVGLKTRPHAIRHSSITRCLDVSGGDVRRARAFSRHASVQTLLIYDDRRADDGGKLAELVAGSVE